MAYFTQGFFDFFQELSENNHRDWFHANKSRYEQHVKKPFYTLVGELIDRIHQDDPQVMIEPKHAVFRINRDIRFSKDKTPYKTNVSAFISPQGRKDHTHPGFYFDLNHQRIYLGGGAYSVDKEQLLQIRTAIASEPDRFKQLLEEEEFQQKYGTVKGEQHKRLPAEFKEAAEKQPLLFNKQFYYMAELDRELLLTDELPDHMMSYYYAAKPIKDFLLEAMKQEA